MGGVSPTEEQLAMFEEAVTGPPAREPYRSVRIDVRGIPRPQGSIQPIRTKNGGVPAMPSTRCTPGELRSNRP